MPYGRAHAFLSLKSGIALKISSASYLYGWRQYLISDVPPELSDCHVLSCCHVTVKWQLPFVFGDQDLLFWHCPRRHTVGFSILGQVIKERRQHGTSPGRNAPALTSPTTISSRTLRLPFTGSPTRSSRIHSRLSGTHSH